MTGFFCSKGDDIGFTAKKGMLSGIQKHGLQIVLIDLSILGRSILPIDGCVSRIKLSDLLIALTAVAAAV